MSLWEKGSEKGSEGRGEGTGEGRGAALPLIKNMSFGRANCGQVGPNVWCCFFSGVLK